VFYFISNDMRIAQKKLQTIQHPIAMMASN